jgi:hypothetical protein
VRDTPDSRDMFLEVDVLTPGPGPLLTSCSTRLRKEIQRSLSQEKVSSCLISLLERESPS